MSINTTTKVVNGIGAYGNENWEFDAHGYLRRRFASIHDLTIKETDRKFRWERKIAAEIDV